MNNDYTRYNICSAWFLDIRISTCYYRSGAAIVVETQDVLSVFDRHFHNPLCFLQYYDASVPLSEISHDNVCLL